MGDSETVVAQTSTVMGYSSSGYTTSEYPAVSSNVTSDGVGSTDTAYPLADGPSLADENVYNTHPTYDAQEPPATSNESNPAVCVANASVNHISQENVVPDSAQVAGFDSSLNGNGVGEMGNLTHTGSGENGSASDDAGRAADQPFEELPALSAEEERLWSILKANSLDFNAWTALIEETEKVAEDNISKIRKVYDTFLAEFPLCYGYWKKYADHEARLGSIDKVVEVYERAVVAVTYSVDIWLHYCMFAISTYEDPDTVRRLSWVHQYTKCCWEDHVQLRAKMASSSAPFQGHSMVVSGRLFDRGLAYVGADYLSYPLWDKYIEYEYSQQQWCRLAMIYTRIFENPNQQLDRYFNSFKELAASRPLSELQSADEATALVTANLEAGAQGVEGEVPSNGVEPSAKAGLTEAEELEKYVAAREDMYKKAKEFDSKIIGFETAIRRPYFHVRPLVDAELENWHGYLDFIEREGDLNKVVKIYERCLIACANYPEYWIRYVLCMEASGSMDLANNALARATQVFVKRQPEIHLFAARFKEQIGDIVGARAAYQLLHSGISPGLLEAVVKHANMEHRLGNLEDAFSLYEQAIATERGKEQSQTLPMLFVQYARFLYLVAANAEKAREVLVEATDNVQLSKPLLEALIHLEAIQSTPKRIDYIDSLVEKFVLPTPDNPNPASITDREELSSIFLEFLDLFGDVEFIKKAEDRHARIFLRHRNTSELRKRHAEDFLASDKAKLARSYAGVPSTTQSVMGAYPAAQNQWAAGYGLQPQAWSQASQAAQAGQQWNPSYGQQAGYGGYAGYGSTYTPQVATSTAQTAAYGTYPPTYPAQQAVPQQSYVQPATAATFAPPTQQQAPPVQQAYYGTYY